MRLDFQNRYGRLTLSLVSEVRPVNEIHGVDLDDAIKFDIDTAERIALITDNRGIQIAPHKVGDKWRCYVVVHDSPSTVAVAKIETLDYVGRDPKQELRDARYGG